MKKIMTAFLFALLFKGPVLSEQIDLSNAYVVNPSSATSLKIESLFFDWKSEIICIRLYGDAVQYPPIYYRGTEAADLMRSLNTANLSTNSLNKRVMNKLINDGIVAGTVTGQPD